jgi:peptidoglycan-associated lipoprotein
MKGLIKFTSIVLSVALLGACTCKKAAKPVSDSDIPLAAVGGPLMDINFDFDSSEITPTAKGILAASAEWLMQNQSASLQVEGHCDERGTNEYNMALGARRAESAKQYLKTLGVAADRISTVSYGEELPLDPASSEAAWARNRRAHFNVQK